MLIDCSRLWELIHKWAQIYPGHLTFTSSLLNFEPILCEIVVTEITEEKMEEWKLSCVIQADMEVTNLLASIQGILLTLQWQQYG